MSRFGFLQRRDHEGYITTGDAQGGASLSRFCAPSSPRPRGLKIRVVIAFNPLSHRSASGPTRFPELLNCKDLLCVFVCTPLPFLLLVFLVHRLSHSKKARKQPP